MNCLIHAKWQLHYTDEKELKVVKVFSTPIVQWAVDLLETNRIPSKQELSLIRDSSLPLQNAERTLNFVTYVVNIYILRTGAAGGKDVLGKWTATVVADFSADQGVSSGLWGYRNVST